MNETFDEKSGDAQELYIDLLKSCLTASIYDESAWKVIEGRPVNSAQSGKLWGLIRDLLRRTLITKLRSRSLLLVRRQKFSKEVRDGGGDWPFFGFTMMGNRRLDNLQACIKSVLANQVPGDLIETGAWRGGGTIFMRALLKTYGCCDRLVWVADSFEGLPRPKDADDGWDLSHVEQLKVSLDQVKANFRRFGLLDDKVQFLPGWFKDTLPSAPIKKLAILRLDGDLYSSTIDVLSNLYAKVSPGGFVIVDDYFAWPACKKAVDDFLREEGIKVSIEQIDNAGGFWRVGSATSPSEFAA